MLNNDFGCQAEEGGVLIPTPVILKTETNTDGMETTIYGNFWMFAYRLEGKILQVTSCGECPGIMKLGVGKTLPYPYYRLHGLSCLLFLGQKRVWKHRRMVEGSHG